MAGGGCPPLRPPVPFAGFESVDMRVGRVLSAKRAAGTRAPCLVLTVDLGPLGVAQSVGQLALVAESDLVGKNVVVCINLGARRMGSYLSEALVLGAPHPDNPEGQDQAVPLCVDERAVPGSQIF